VIVVSREERVLRVTLNRADKRNALSNEVCEALVSAVEDAQHDADAGSILLDAQGDVFCAGMDLDDAIAPGAVSSTAVHERLFTMGSWTRIPIVAAVNGPALGGGLGLVANAHIVVAAHGASFGLTEIRIGMWPFVIWRAVARALGERRALSLALTGRIFSVNEAVQWGLVHEVTPAFEVDDRATAIAQHLSESSPQALALGLEFVSRTRGLASDEAGRIALKMRAQAFTSDDFREGVTAFREKRKPKWKHGA
jgi:enoyl-CoA hydratase/carnithine racemase